LATLSRALIAGSEGRLSKAKQTVRELHETDAFDPKRTWDNRLSPRVAAPDVQPIRGVLCGYISAGWPDNRASGAPHEVGVVWAI